MTRIIFLFLIFTSVFANAQNKAQLADAQWKLVNISNLTTGKESIADTNCRITLIFGSDGRYNGFSGWNYFGGKYQLSGENNIKFEYARQTEMAGPAKCEFGEELLKSYPAVKTYSFEQDMLSLISDSLKIVFKKARIIFPD